MIKLPNTLTFRLTAWYVSAFVGFLFVAVLALYFSTNAILSQRMDEDLVEDIEEYRVLLQKTADKNRLISEIQRETAAGAADSVFYRLLDQQGNLLFSSDLDAWQGVQTDHAALTTLISDEEPVLVSGNYPQQEYLTRMIYGDIGSGMILHVGESTEQKQEIMDLLWTVFSFVVIMGVPVAALVGWWIARQAVRGIEAVSLAAEGIERGELHHRVSVNDQRDEIQNLADRFNAMAEKIRTLISEMREMTDNIAHDLRSPLGRIRAISEAALSADGSADNYRTAAEDTLMECDRLIQMINTTLDVAEAEAGVSASKVEEIDLSQLASDACDIFEPVAEQKSIRFSINMEPDCRFQGDKQNLQRMLANVLDNALKYTPCNGAVKVLVKRLPDKINIAVSDTGVGIPEPEQPRVFERFYRCDQSRSQEGCGLGLSYARAVARAHGGEITVSSVPGNSIFVISLPHGAVPASAF